MSHLSSPAAAAASPSSPPPPPSPSPAPSFRSPSQQHSGADNEQQPLPFHLSSARDTSSSAVAAASSDLSSALCSASLPDPQAEPSLVSPHQPLMRDSISCNGDVAVMAMHAAYAANSAASGLSSPADFSSAASTSNPASPRLAGRSSSPPPPSHAYFQPQAAASHFHYIEMQHLPFASTAADMLPFFQQQRQQQQQQLYHHQTLPEPLHEVEGQERPETAGEAEVEEGAAAAGNAPASGSKRRRVSGGSPVRAVTLQQQQQQQQQQQEHDAVAQPEPHNGHHDSGREQHHHEAAAHEDEHDSGVEDDDEEEEIAMDANAASDASSLSSSSLSGSPPSSPSRVVSSSSPTAVSQLASSTSSSATTPSHNSSGLTPASSPSHHSKTEIPPALNKSVIECGVLDLVTGTRQLSHHSPYFNKVVEVYTAVNDPQRRTLYRASALAEKFSCATNKVGMYLARRRHCESGLWQSVGFRYKPSGRTGLKAGGYFLSQEICESFQWHFMKQVGRKRGRGAVKDAAGGAAAAAAAAAASAAAGSNGDNSSRQEKGKVKLENQAEENGLETMAGNLHVQNGLGKTDQHAGETGGSRAATGEQSAKVKVESVERDDFLMRRVGRSNDVQHSDDEPDDALEDDDEEERRRGAADGLSNGSLDGGVHHILSSPSPPLSASLGLPYSALTLDPSAAYSPQRSHPLTHPHALSRVHLTRGSTTDMERAAELFAAAQQQQQQLLLSQGHDHTIYHNNGMLSSLPGSDAQHAHDVVKQQQEDEQDGLARSGLMLRPAQDGVYGHPLVHQYPRAHHYAADTMAMNGLSASVLSSSMHGQMERSSSTGLHHPVLLPLSQPSMLSPQQQQRMALMEHQHQQQLQMQMQMLPPSHSLVHSQSYPHLQHSVDGHLEHLHAQRRLQAMERLHAQQQHMRALSAHASPQRLHPAQHLHQLEMDAATAAHQQQLQQMQQMHQQQQLELEQRFYHQQQQTALAALTATLPLVSTSPLPHNHSAASSPVSLSPLPLPHPEDVYAMADGRMQL